MKRYGRSGWYGERHRHYLAAKGISTKRYNAKRSELSDDEKREIAKENFDSVVNKPDWQRQGWMNPPCVKCGKHLTPDDSGRCMYCRPWTDDPDILNEYFAKKSIETSQEYKEWRKLVNMSPGELKKFMEQYGDEAGLSRAEASKQGIRSGRDSARAIIRMRSKSPENWTESDKEWLKRQNSFVARMKGVEGPLYDEKGRPTRKLLALKVWGHDPEKRGKWKGGNGHPYMAKKDIDLQKYAGEWKQKSVKNEPWFQKGCKDVRAKYTPVKGGIKVENTCVTKDGKKKTIKGFAKPVSKDNRTLAVDFGFNFLNRGNYEIVKVNPSYTRAKVRGGKTVWELER